MEPATISPSKAAKLAEIGSFHTNQEMVLTTMILGFALLSLLFLYLCLRTGRASEFVLRIYVITIIIFGTLLAVSSSYTTEQIAPVVGLFGTIAGYVLGRSERAGSRSEGDGNSAPDETTVPPIQ
jgi:hydrogenase/urease accessory protein HupE